MMIRYGVDYYPEHWHEERWATDAHMMQEAHFNTVRLAEFAWAKMEPEPGVFNFDWLYRAIQTLSAHGLQIVLGTPTASPPPWVMAMYPDAYLLHADGRRATYGGRREYCPTHAGYRERSRSITRAMAEHFGHHSAVIGWQTDNEFGDRCYCESCQHRFQEWLQVNFGTLDRVNERWGTIFWSHTYTDWSQIPTPQQTAQIHNPGLELDYLRFMSEMYTEFQQEQIDILRELCPSQFITHNLMGFGYDKLDYFDVASNLDFVTWDNYPRGFWIEEFDIDPVRLALGHATMYGLKQQPFWVMEAQSGPAGWTTIGATPRPGEIRLWAYQAIAHGADAIIYFRWRSARFGAEQYWHGILNHDGSAHRRYEEVQRMGAELQRIGKDMSGAEIRTEAALLLSYDSRFAFQMQPNNLVFNYSRHFQDYFGALHRLHVPTTIVSPDSDFGDYKLLVAPALYVLDERTAHNLWQFVEDGGVLVLTARSGVKEPSNTVVDLPLPGLLADLCGLTISDYDSLLPSHMRQIAFTDVPEVTGATATQWCDILELQTAEALAYYSEDFYSGESAIALNRVGRGFAIYVGTIGNTELVERVIEKALELAKIDVDPIGSDGVELTARWKNNRKLLFLLNHSSRAQSVSLDKPYINLLEGQVVDGELEIEAKDVMILMPASDE